MNYSTRGTRFSALPEDLEGPSNHELLKNYAFHIMYVNKHRHKPGFFKARYKIAPIPLSSPSECEFFFLLKSQLYELKPNSDFFQNLINQPLQ